VAAARVAFLSRCASALWYSSSTRFPFSSASFASMSFLNLSSVPLCVEIHCCIFLTLPATPFPPNFMSCKVTSSTFSKLYVEYPDRGRHSMTPRNMALTAAIFAFFAAFFASAFAFREDMMRVNGGRLEGKR
jgi:hypothetical protein